jgi:hypothetical protein
VLAAAGPCRRSLGAPDGAVTEGESDRAPGTGPRLGYFPTGLPGPEALAEVAAGIRQARPAGAPFDVIVDLPPDEDTGPWERAGATWAVTDFGLQPSRSSVLAVINDGPS